MNICLEENKILCRIKKHIPVIETVILVKFFCFQVILRNNKTVGILLLFILPHSLKQAVHHMGFLGLNAAGQLQNASVFRETAPDLLVFI